MSPIAQATFDERHPLKGPRYWSRKGTEGPWDVVVVGSGMGGLTTGALLADLGYRVLMLEQHYVPGGFTHAFSHKGWVWDVGVHAIGEVTGHTLSGRLLRHLTRDRLQWASLGPVYEEFHFPDGLRVDFPDDPAQFRANLVAAFPQEATAIDRYLRVVREAATAMQNHYASRAAPAWTAPLLEAWASWRVRPWLQRTVEEVLGSLTDDARLRAVLAAQWGYYGTPPSQAAFGIQAIVTKHFLHGAYYPVGGAQEIARCLCRTIAESGGWTRVVADVEQVLVENGRATGVRLVDGEEIRAARVVVASGIGASLDLLPETLRADPWSEDVRSVGAGPAHLCLYLGFRGDPRHAGASGANKWFYRTWDWDEAVWNVTSDRALEPSPVLYTSFPSLKDPAHDPGTEELHTGEVVTFVPWREFQPWASSPWRRRGKDYEDFKQRLTQQILDQLFAEMPDLEPLVAYSELSTPVSTETFCRPLRGSIYGLDATPERFQNRKLRPRGPVQDLYFSGGDVTSGGVMGAFAGGLLAALAMEPLAVGRRLRKL